MLKEVMELLKPTILCKLVTKVKEFPNPYTNSE